MQGDLEGGRTISGNEKIYRIFYVFTEPVFFLPEKPSAIEFSDKLNIWKLQLLTPIEPMDKR